MYCELFIICLLIFIIIDYFIDIYYYATVILDSYPFKINFEKTLKPMIFIAFKPSERDHG